ncbi:MAG: diacylglycerol/lipid kinase family protein [Flavisolibacter sp.]
MQNQTGLKLLFVVNPISGGKQKQDWEASIRDYFQKLPHSIEFYLLTGKDDRVSIRHHMEQVKPDRVVAVGGDGTVKMLAELLKKTSLPLGIIPAGSANGMAKELGIPEEANEALQIITNGSCRKLDVIDINHKETCIHLSDVGLNAMLVRYFEKSDKRGMWGYARAVLRVLWGKQAMHIHIKTDHEELERKAFMVVIANAQTYGTGAIINPQGKTDDGLFEVIVVRKLNVWELFKMLVTHKPFDPECIEIFKTKNAELKIRHRAYFQIDGEYQGKESLVYAQIQPQVLYMMLPVPKEKEAVA